MTDGNEQEGIKCPRQVTALLGTSQKVMAPETQKEVRFLFGSCIGVKCAFWCKLDENRGACSDRVTAEMALRALIAQDTAAAAGKREEPTGTEEPN